MKVVVYCAWLGSDLNLLMLVFSKTSDATFLESTSTSARTSLCLTSKINWLAGVDKTWFNSTPSFACWPLKVNLCRDTLIFLYYFPHSFSQYWSSWILNCTWVFVLQSHNSTSRNIDVRTKQEPVIEKLLTIGTFLAPWLSYSLNH